MIQTAEQLLETVRALPKSERKKFYELAEVEKQKILSENGAKKDDSTDERAKFQLAMKWLDENRQNFLGQWVCLDGDRLVAYGADALKIYKEAREKGIEVPFVEHIVEEKKAYGGGIEACPQL